MKLFHSIKRYKPSLFISWSIFTPRMWFIGRFLKREEVVHHKNRDKVDNRIGNLELCSSTGQHSLKHHPEVMHKLRTINKGIRRSPKTEFKKGQKPWNFGKKFAYKPHPWSKNRPRNKKGRFISFDGMK